jgi:hypothetical protein
MATNAEHGHSHAHGRAHGHRRAAPSGIASPLARGLAFRLFWAGGLSVFLWLSVAWALQ